MEENELPFEFTGFTIDHLKNGMPEMSQNDYLRKLEELPDDSDCSYFRSTRMKLGWVVNTHPDVLLETTMLAQVTNDHFSKTNFQCHKAPQ